VAATVEAGGGHSISGEEMRERIARAAEERERKRRQEEEGPKV